MGAQTNERFGYRQRRRRDEIAAWVPPPRDEAEAQASFLYLELVLKWPNLVPDRIGSSKRGNIIDTIRRFLLNLAILAFSLPEIDLRQPLYLVVSKSMNNFSLGRSSISKKGILGTDPT